LTETKRVSCKRTSFVHDEESNTYSDSVNGLLNPESESAATSAKVSGARAIHKAEQKAPDLHTLLKETSAIAFEVDTASLDPEMVGLIALLIDLADDYEPDADFEPELGSVEGIMGRQERWADGSTDDRELDDEREPDEDFEPSLGSLNIRMRSEYFQPKGRIYTAGILTPASQSQANWAVGTSDDLEFDPLDYGEHDPADLGELPEHGFANPDDPCSDVFAKGGRNV
tara:strand:- start:20513 stop:21196 length:684 start_codon:yes stop_codon:yes gene_type:complete